MLLQLCVGASGLLLLLLAAQAAIMPQFFAKAMGLAATSPHGKSSVRGDLGALFGGMAAVALHAAYTRSTALLPLPLAQMVFILLVRALTQATAPFSAPLAQAIAVETAVVALWAAVLRWGF